ncbi:MAG: sarcosine oxidase subunit alpha family protein, partial [Gammaproteobacteria bacterium]|nr:sarcosine oxidase subunit alpha family protein [Gammaproteobacteria bacterium]
MDKEFQRKVQQKHRLKTGGLIDRSEPCNFTFNGKRYQGYRGDTLASALLASGVKVIGRSFKYSRPRGLMTAGVEEPNALVQLEESISTQTPNVRATVQALYDGLTCSSVNGWPSVDNDAMSLVGKIGGAAMAPGFYYKTFMYPSFMWKTYEKVIRRAAGLGRSPKVPDTDRYDHMNHHTDVTVVGAGPAGLVAALTAARTGIRVALIDEAEQLGGSLLYSTERLDNAPAQQWIQSVLDELESYPNVLLLPRTTVTGCHDHNFLTACERRADHLSVKERGDLTRQRMHKIRSTSVILATGAHERPLVFGNNDLPGCFLAGAVSQYIHQYAVVPGQKLVLMTTNDHAYQCAFDWQSAGRSVVAIIDTRQNPGAVADRAEREGITVRRGMAVIEAFGTRAVAGVDIATLNTKGTFVTEPVQQLRCDTVATSGGWSPVVHLACHTGNKPEWREDIAGFVMGNSNAALSVVGSANGEQTLSDSLSSGLTQGRASAEFAIEHGALKTKLPRKELYDSVHANLEPAVAKPECGESMALYLVPHVKTPSRAPKQFVDMQNDVTAAGIQMSVREGFENIEHVKRYTAMGFGTDQGKTGNINGLAIVAKSLNQSISDTGTTTFRPNYAPVSFGAISGAHVGALFDPKRFTPMHQWHLEHGAEFENVGQWKRPWYFPQPGESMQEAVNRECLATRHGVGILDASTLGKIDIQGQDAREFLGRVYTNAWAKLAPGRCRYGLMCGEDGNLMDDGVTSCLAENHFLMTTTTGGAASVLSWLELYKQTEWPELDVYFTSVTDHWATMTIAGPDSRRLLADVCTDIDLGNEAFQFMEWRTGTVAGVPARVYRISFTGELSYEINVPAHFGLHVWQALMASGERFNITPYGTEAMHVLRAEKGFVIVGQDTDGSVTPMDINHGWAVANNKPFSYIGKRGMQRADLTRSDRKQLVGLITKEPTVVLEEGAQAVWDPSQSIPMTMIGHVTSSYYSACLG